LPFLKLTEKSSPLEDFFVLGAAAFCFQLMFRPAFHFNLFRFVPHQKRISIAIGAMTEQYFPNL